MAQQKYLLANQSLGKSELNLETDDIRVILIDSADYTVNFTTDQFLSDIPALARGAVSAALAGKVVDGTGAFDATDIILSAVTGDVFEAVVIYQHTGVEATSRLISYDDTPVQLPATPNGTDVTIQWDNGTNKIFKI